MSIRPAPDARLGLVILGLVLLLGTFLRLPPHLFEKGQPLRPLVALHPLPAQMQLGFDEALYREYTDKLLRFGLGAYPEIVERYREKQTALPGSILPPVRFLYIFSTYLWRLAFDGETLTALKNVAALFSILTLFLAALFAARLRLPARGLGVVALMAFAPTQLHMSQHALVDGFFTFWALAVLWLLWENLRAPARWPWLVAYTAVFAAVVLTKENAFFVWIAVLVILLANRWLKFGYASRELWLATCVGPLLGFVVLIFLAGGIDSLIATYRLSVTKNYTLEYAILTGDGPWQRYLVDLLLVSPVVTLLALGTVFTLRRERTIAWFFFLFVAASYLVMGNVKYGMNLRYANMWDFALCVLAFVQLQSLSLLWPRRPTRALLVAVTLTCALELRTYVVIEVKYPLYEMITPELMRAQKILKSRADLTPPKETNPR